MSAIVSFFKTLAGLFVDDGWLAALVLAWVLVSIAALHYWPLAMVWGPLFLLGVVLLLSASVFRAALMEARKRIDMSRQ